MNSNKIIEQLNIVGSTPGKKDKVTLLTPLMKDETFKKVISLILDPLTTYGMAKIPTITENGTGEFTDYTWEMLESMCKRTLTGNMAKAAVKTELERLSIGSADLLVRIITKKIKAGFGASTVNKIIKGFIPETPYMRCSLPNKVNIKDDFDWVEGVFSQEKADGMFANVNNELEGHVEVTSRQGIPFPREELEKIGFFAEVRGSLPIETQTHGEFVVALHGEVLPRELSNGVMSRICSGGVFEEGEELLYKVWDCIPLSEVKPKNKYNVPYKKRMFVLETTINGARIKPTMIMLINTRVAHSIKEAFNHYAEMLAEGKEGTVFKSKTAIWKDGDSKEQIKLKLKFIVDLRITGINLGKIGSKNEDLPGTFACESLDGLLKVNVTVKNEAVRKSAQEFPEEWIDSILAVKANNISAPTKSNSDWSLSLGVMAETSYRTDKFIADTLVQIQDQFEAAMTGV